MIGALDVGVGLVVGSAIVGLTTLALAGVGLRRKASEDYVNQLEHRIELSEGTIADLRRRMERCEDVRDSLARENRQLLRQIVLGEKDG